MNSSAEDLKDYLDGISSLALTFKTNLFVARMPDTPDQCVVLYDSGGFAPYSNDYQRPTVQIRTRGAQGGYQTIYDLTKAIWDELHELANQTINLTRYIAIYAVDEPFSLGLDDNNRPLFSMNFRIDRSG